MTNKFSCFLTQKGRWLTATLFLLFSLGIGQMWGAATNLSSSVFIKTYVPKTGSSDPSASDVMADFPTYLSGNIQVANGKSVSSSITSPHDFSAIDADTKYWRIKLGSSNTITITEVSNIAKIHLYGGATNDNRTLKATFKTTVGDVEANEHVDVVWGTAATTIVDHVYDLSAVEGYSSSSAYTLEIKSASGGDYQIYGIYLEAGSSGPSVSAFSPATGAKLKTGATVTVTGSTGSTIYYKWATSTQTADDIYNSGSGSHGEADAATVTSSGIASANGTTLYAIARNGTTNSAVASASYTIDDTAPAFSSSTPANSATGVAASGTIVLTFSEALASVDGSKFTLTGATKGTVAIDGTDATKVNVPYSGAASETTVTLSVSAGAVADAAGNALTAALSDISFTTAAATPCPASGTVFSIEVTSSSSVRPPRATDASHPGWLELGDYATISGAGEAEAGNMATGSDKGGISSTAINLDGNDAVFWVALNCDLEPGDKITATVTGNTIYLTPDLTRAGGISLATGTNTYTVQKNDKLDGESNIYFWKGGGSAKISSLTITRPTPHTLSYVVAPAGKGTVTLGKTSLIEGATTTATYSAIDAAYDFDEWQISGTGASLDDASANPVTITMGSTDATITLKLKAAATKYTVTYSLNGASGDAPTQAAVAAGTEITLADAPSWAGHAFDGWLCSADAGVKDAASVYTMTAANTTFTAQWHEVDCKIYSLTGGIGSAEIVADESNAEVNATSLVLKGSNAVIKLTPATGETFKAGDVVTISGTVGKTTKNFGVKISASNNKGSGLGTASASGTANPMTASVTLEGDADYLYICRADGTTQTLLTFEVHRSCATGTEAGLSYATAEVNKYTTASAFTNPLTNANGLTVVYGTSDATVATVNANGAVTIVGAGDATITAYTAVQTKAGTLYAAGTATYTLHVTTPPTYAVTYAKGDVGADGTMTDPSSPYVEGAEVTLLANTFTAPSGKEFDEWVVTKTVGGEAVAVSEGKFTMPGEAVTVTATWKALAAKYTVHYMDADGTTPLAADELVVVSQKPAGLAEDPTKPLYTFAAWQLSGVDIALDADSWASVLANAEVTLTARWAKTYANSVDFVQKITADGTSGWKAYLEANNYYIASESGVSFDNSNAFDTGLKMKDNTSNTLSFRAAPGKVIDLTVGKINGMTIAINGGAAPALTSGTDATHLGVSHYYAAGEQEVVLAETATAYNIIRKITIRDPYTVSFEAHGDADPSALQGLPSVTLPDASNGTASLLGWFDAETGGNKIGDAGDTYIPTANITLHAQWEAVSTDARLASITLDPSTGTWEPAFDPEVVNYTYTMPYGTAAVPTITGATSVSAKAKTPTIVSQASAWNETAVIRGVAESDDTKQYNITMKIAPKDPTCLVWADIPSANTLTFNASKSLLNEADVTLAISGVSGKESSAPSGVKFQKPGYIKIQKNEGSFEEGDIVALDVTYVASTAMHVFKVQTPESAADVIGTGTTATTPAGVNKVTITENAATLWLARPDNSSAYKDWNPHVDYVAVYRAMNPVLKSITFAGVEATVNEAGKTVTVTVPNATNLGTMAVVPTIFRNAPHATTPEAVTTNGGEWAEGDNTYRIMDKDGDYTDYTVTITRAAVSHDATLSALTVDGNAIALEDGVYTYAYEYETGTAVSPAPVVAAIAHDANAKSVEITQASDKKGTATVVVTAEDNSTTQTYTINFSISTKIKVVIFDGKAASEGAAWKTSPDGTTNASWARSNLSTTTTTVGGYSYQMATGGSTGASKNIAVTVPVNYQPYFELVQATNSGTTERKAFITTTANGSGTKLYELANAKNTEPTRGMSAGLTEETTYYIHSNASINFYEVILYLEPLAPKAATPTLSGLADLAACTLGTDELTVTASDLDGGTAHYQWYKVVEGDDPDEAVGTDANTYAPAVAGNYYVVVTNQKDGCRDNSKKSDEVTVSVKTHTEITVAPLNQRAEVGNNATLSVTAIGDGTIHYTWYTCDDEAGTNPVAVDPANDAATYEVTVTAAMNQWYKVTVHSDCGEDQSATAKVSEFVPTTPANVTTSILWDWTSTAWPASGEVAFSNTAASAPYELLADADAIVPNNDGFRSDMLYGKGQWIWRSGNKFFQGSAIKFTTTVAGKVRVYFRSTSSGNTVNVAINGTEAGSRTNSFGWSNYVEVPAGEVEILCTGDGYTRIQKIEFLALAHQRTTGYNAGDLGTVCLEDATFIEGANLYELAGLNENGYLAFDQVDPAELEAGKPYLFEVTNPSKISFYKPVGAAHTDTEEAHKGMIGTFSGTTLSQGADNLYYFSGRHIWRVNDFTVAIPIPDHRCYVNYDAVQAAGPAQAPAAGRRRVTLGVQGKGTATDINNVEGDNVQPVKLMINGQLFILRGEKLYDATGRLVK